MCSQPWNEFNFPQPPIVTIGVKNSNLDLPALRKTFNDAIVFYESQSDLEESAAFCSRILARRNNSFHNLKGYRELRKVNSALCRLLRLDIVNILCTFNGNLPDFMKTEGFKTQIPSQECFDYVLLRLIALQKLYIRITECCLVSASYFMKILSKNFFFEILTVFLSTIARIWKICTNNANKTAKYYNDLLKYRATFPLKTKVLCENFEFPVLEIMLEETSKPLTKKLFDFVEKNNKSIDLTENIYRSNTSSSIVEQLPITTSTYTALSNQREVDVGVIVSRESMSSGQAAARELKTLENILIFIKEEEKRRKRNLADSVTKNVSDKLWKVFRKKITMVPTNDNRSAVKLVKKFLGNI